MQVASLIAANLARVREQIAKAAGESGRQSDEITLVAVTKYVDAATARLLPESGCSDLGESRPQSLWEKAELLADSRVRWHMIGHLQRNKAKRTLPYVRLLHSGDSLRLLDHVNEEAAQQGLTLDTLLEVNISGDATKHGFPVDEIAPALAKIAALGHLRVRGLMTMAALEGGRERARRDFAALRELRDRLVRECPAGIELKELSMGMSGDFPEAIREGATIVRVGSALFKGLA